MVGWLDRLQQRSRALGFVIAVFYKHVDDQGGYLAALIAYYSIVSLFPLLLLFTTVLSITLIGHAELQREVMQTAFNQFPAIGSQLAQPEQLSGGVAAVVIGIVGAVYGGLGVGQAVQNAMDTMWAVPRNRRRDPIRSRIQSLMLLAVLGTAAIAATVLSAVGRAADDLGWLGKAGVTVTTIVLNCVICLVAFRVTTTRHLSYRQVLPGALLAAVLWQLLQWFGAGYISRAMKSASAINSVFALVIGLVAFLYLISISLVLCAQVNVVRVNRLYPRALLAPFTDNVQLTRADERTYTGRAKAEQVKGFQRVDVKYVPPPVEPAGPRPGE